MTYFSVLIRNVDLPLLEIFYASLLSLFDLLGGYLFPFLKKKIKNEMP